MIQQPYPLGNSRTLSTCICSGFNGYNNIEERVTEREAMVAGNEHILYDNKIRIYKRCIYVISSVNHLKIFNWNYVIRFGRSGNYHTFGKRY